MRTSRSERHKTIRRPVKPSSLISGSSITCQSLQCDMKGGQEQNEPVCRFSAILCSMHGRHSGADLLHCPHRGLPVGVRLHRHLLPGGLALGHERQGMSCQDDNAGPSPSLLLNLASAPIRSTHATTTPIHKHGENRHMSHHLGKPSGALGVLL